MLSLVVNKIRCRKCGDVIESKSEYDLKACSCKAVAVDGGLLFLNRIGEPEDWEELSEYEEE